jgi:predicted nucleotidyltransferase
VFTGGGERIKMNKKEKIIQKMREIKKDLKDTSKTVMSLIKNHGTVTGSTAWGLNTEDTDVDIIVPCNCELTWNDVVQFDNGIYLHANEEDGIEHYSQNDFKSLYVIHKNTLYNLLFMFNTEIYDKWIYATNKMSDRISKDSEFKEKMKDKEARIEYFEELKNEYL